MSEKLTIPDARPESSAEIPADALPLIQQAEASDDVLRAVECLTATDSSVRGCKVNPDRIHLQALQNLTGWTIGGFRTRPTLELAAQKNEDRLLVLLSYRQEHPPATPPRVAMYDYLCESIFGVPMQQSVMRDELAEIRYQDHDGNLHTPNWREPDWDAHGTKEPLEPKFLPNKYPYQVPVLDPDAHWMQRQAQHWLLWFFHFPWESLPDPADEVVDAAIRKRLQELVRVEGFEQVDYIWYKNPHISVPDMFHVQVFWIVPKGDSTPATPAVDTFLVSEEQVPLVPTSTQGAEEAPSVVDILDNKTQ